MLIPKRVKRRRQHRGTMKGKAQKGNVIAYGEYGRDLLQFQRIYARQSSHTPGLGAAD